MWKLNDFSPCNLYITLHYTTLQGYKQKNAFIIAQAPMKSTKEDFWKMVYEKECAIIVMLSGLEELDEVINMIIEGAYMRHRLLHSYKT